MSAPAGHNPEVSMLQGGNAAITPMQGGGAPPGYSGESMLQGGTAPITPLQGGGPPLNYSGESMLEGGTATITPLQGGATGPPQPAFPSVLQAAAAAAASTPGQVRATRARLAAARKPRAQTVGQKRVAAARQARAAAAATEEESEEEPAIATQEPPQPLLTPNDFLIEVYRVSNPVGHMREHELYTLLRAKEFYLQSQDMVFRNALLDLINSYEQRTYKSRWGPVNQVGPTLPMEGRWKQTTPDPQVLTQFSRGIVVLPKDTKTVVAIPPIRGNLPLLINVLGDLERYGILEVTNGKIEIKLDDTALVFMPPYYAPPIVNGKDNRGKNIALLSIFLEIEANNHNSIFVLAEHTSDNFTVGKVFNEYRQGGSGRPFTNFLEPSYILTEDGKVAFSSAATGEVSLPFSANPAPRWTKPTADQTSAYIVRSLGETDPFPIPQEKSDKGAGCEFHHGYLDPRTANPIGLTMAKVKNELDESIEAPILLAFRFGSAPLLICSGGKEIDAKGDYKTPTRFIAAEELTDPDARTEQIEFVDKDGPNKSTYGIRIPEFTNSVFEDWNRGKYTVDEAAFLNSLDLSPAMLDEIFGNEWTTRVALFLQSTAVSKCFTDDTLLLKSECEYNRNFLEEVYSFFISEDLTLDRRRQLRDLEEEAELETYRDYVKQKARTATEVPDIPSISRHAFHKSKKAFGTLTMYIVGDKRCANFMLINKQTGAISYHRVEATMAEFDADSGILLKRINDLKKQYKNFFVVY